MVEIARMSGFRAQGLRPHHLPRQRGEGRGYMQVKQRIGVGAKRRTGAWRWCIGSGTRAKGRAGKGACARVSRPSLRPRLLLPTTEATCDTGSGTSLIELSH